MGRNIGFWGIKHLNTEKQRHRGIFKQREKRKYGRYGENRVFSII